MENENFLIKVNKKNHSPLNKAVRHKLYEQTLFQETPSVIPDSEKVFVFKISFISGILPN